MNSVESTDHPGYYGIPGFSRYVISKDGSILNVEKGTHLSGSTNPAGYHNYRLKGDDGKTTTLGRHRALGLTFKNPGEETSKLVVNHENGIKGDDFLDNLEWVTQQGNVEHAGANGLTEKCVPVSIRNARTGEVFDYPSMRACALAQNVSKDAVSYRCSVGDARVFQDGFQYRTGSSHAPWVIPESVETSILETGRSRAVLVRDVSTGVVRLYEKLSDFAHQAGIALSTAWQWVERKDQPILPGNIQVRWIDDQSEWRIPDDPVSEFSHGNRRKIRSVNSVTGEVMVFESGKACAAHHGLNPTTLNERLKSNGQKVFKDGYAYSYV